MVESQNTLSTLDQSNDNQSLPSNYYFERSLYFRALSVESRIEVYKQIYPIYCSCYGQAEFEGIVQFYENLPGDLIVLMLKSKVPDNNAGFIVCATDSIYFQPDNTSKENLFKVSYHSFCLHPNHRGQKLGIHMFYATQSVLKELYAGYNRVSFNHFGNIFFYKLFHQSTHVFFPGPFEETNKNVKDLFFAIKSNYLLDGITEISEFLVEFQLSILGFDKERYKMEHLELDPVSKFFVDSFDFRPGYFLLGLFIHEVIDGNSLQLEPRIYEKLAVVDYAFRDIRLELE